MAQSGPVASTRASAPRPRVFATSCLSVPVSLTHTHTQIQGHVWPEYCPSRGWTWLAGSLGSVAAAGPTRVCQLLETTSKLSSGVSCSNDNIMRHRISIRFGRGDCWLLHHLRKFTTNKQGVRQQTHVPFQSSALTIAYLHWRGPRHARSLTLLIGCCSVDSGRFPSIKQNPSNYVFVIKNTTLKFPQTKLPTILKYNKN